MISNNNIKNLKRGILLIFFGLIFSVDSMAQNLIPSGTYSFESTSEGMTTSHLFLVDKNYLVHTVFSKSPANFEKTVGGFYEIKNDHIILDLEFNSNYKNDSIDSLSIPFNLSKKQLSLKFDGKMNKMEASTSTAQELDGKWLMAGRVTEEGESFRDTTRPRKTMKFLQNGYFQWIAFNTETMDFSGTGGGAFTSKDGKYAEHIQFFSRDNSRTGATLEFNYDIKDGNWHHTGKSSKGDPLHEIWSPRK